MSLLSDSLTLVKSFINNVNKSHYDYDELFEDISAEETYNNSVSSVSAENVPDFLDISPKKQSISVHVASHMIKDVQDILDNDLNLIKHNIQNGSIYKTADNAVTVTLYTTTGTINIQGKSIYIWLDNFVLKCNNLESGIIKNQPRSSTPISVSSIFNDSEDDIMDLNKSQNQGKTDLPVNAYEMMSKDELIKIIKNLETKLKNEKIAQATSDASTQTLSTPVKDSNTQSDHNITITTECQTEIPAGFMVSTSTQSVPIPKPRVQKEKPTEKIVNQKPSKIKRQKSLPDKNLMIGSSILKNIKEKGLTNCDVIVKRGAHVNDITDIIMKSDIKNYKTIILQVGGNDLAYHRNIHRFIEDYESLLYAVRAFGGKDSNIIVSGLLPRADVSVLQANNELENLCQFLDIIFINQLGSFADNGDFPKFSMFSRDGIHLNRKGTSRYLHNINNVIGILHKLVVACNKCGELNHSTDYCKFQSRVKCFCCGLFGHKEKMCKYVKS